RSGYHGKDKNNQSNKQCRETTYGWFFCAFSLYADRERELSSAVIERMPEVVQRQFREETKKYFNLD
ncbi:hypothetical protein ONJ45_25875, partial [Salmonella enterica subsp. enterica serovar Virginia]|nr:hypothetical protein [Salmonella enterica subsp. enterica serovar Virginia]